MKVTPKQQHLHLPTSDRPSTRALLQLESSLHRHDCATRSTTLVSFPCASLPNSAALPLRFPLSTLPIRVCLLSISPAIPVSRIQAPTANRNTKLLAFPTHQCIRYEACSRREPRSANAASRIQLDNMRPRLEWAKAASHSKVLKKRTGVTSDRAWLTGRTGKLSCTQHESYSSIHTLISLVFGSTRLPVLVRNVITCFAAQRGSTTPVSPTSTWLKLTLAGLSTICPRRHVCCRLGTRSGSRRGSTGFRTTDLSLHLCDALLERLRGGSHARIFGNKRSVKATWSGRGASSVFGAEDGGQRKLEVTEPV